MIGLNKIYNEDCIQTMARMQDNFIDLTVTSPPYDNLRTYNGYSFDFETIAKELFRVTKEGGVVVWIVGDATIKGSETGTSFKQALYFIECGFNLHDTMIYEKPNCYAFDSRQGRYKNIFEYMFIFSKGKPKTHNLIKDKPVKSAGKVFNSTKGRDKNGNLRKNNNVTALDFQVKYNIWKFSNDARGTKHPAIFPEQLANDHIISWSNENDIVYDCFMGSGTTAKMALSNERNYIGSEISKEYCHIIEERINNHKKQLKLL